jgi:hypothetical protein
VAKNQIYNISSGIAGLERHREHATTGSLDFFFSCDEVRPIRSLQEDIGKKFGDQLPGGILIKQSNGIDRLESPGQLRALDLRDQRTGEPLGAPNAGVRIQRQNQPVAQRSGLFQEPDVSRMEQVIAPVGENDDLALLFPALTLFEERRAKVETSHGFQCSGWRTAALNVVERLTR